MQWTEENDGVIGAKRIKETTMDDNFIERLRQEQRDQMENPRGCKVQMAEAGEPYPCAQNCPCALLDGLLVMADRIKELKARAEAAEAELSRYKLALAYAAIVVDQVAQNEDVEANSLMAALLEIEAVLPKIKEQADE